MGLSKNIAYRLRTLREAAGLSQQEVAERADLSLSLVAKMEQGRKADPRASTLLALAAALGVRPGQLIEDLTPPPEGTFPKKKGKKGKKKKKKQPAVGSGYGIAGESIDTAGIGEGLIAGPGSLNVIVNGDTEQSVAKKKKKKAK